MFKCVKSETPEAIPQPASAPQALPAESKEGPQALYEERLQKYKEATKDLELSSLFKHILYVLDAKNCSSPSSIARVLKNMGSSAAEFKGFAIHTFNAVHRGSSCPFFKNTPLSKSLHLGTTRIWKEDGSVDEARWQQFLKNASEENGSIFTLSKVQAYLQECTEKDPEEEKTGRKTTPYLPLSKSMQVNAAVLAWNEVFDRLTCGWQLKENGELEPYISTQVVREFFEDSPVAYLRAECGLLPVPKPQLESEFKVALAS